MLAPWPRARRPGLPPSARATRPASWARWGGAPSGSASHADPRTSGGMPAHIRCAAARGACARPPSRGRTRPLLRPLPILTVDLGHPDVDPSAVHEEVPPHDAALAIPRLLERAPAAHVRHVDPGPDLAQTQLHEGVLRAQPHRLAGIARAPLGPVTEPAATPGVAPPPVALVPARRAAPRAAALQDDAPGDAARIVGDRREARLLLASARRSALNQVARDLHV